MNIDRPTFRNISPILFSGGNQHLKCSQCRRILPTSSFYKERRYTNRGGYTYLCKYCTNKRLRRLRKKKEGGYKKGKQRLRFVTSKKCCSCQQVFKVGANGRSRFFYQDRGKPDHLSARCRECTLLAQKRCQVNMSVAKKTRKVRRDKWVGLIAPSGISRRTYFAMRTMSPSQRMEVWARGMGITPPEDYRIPEYEYRAKFQGRIVRFRKRVETALGVR